MHNVAARATLCIFRRNWRRLLLGNLLNAVEGLRPPGLLGELGHVNRAHAAVLAPGELLSRPALLLLDEDRLAGEHLQALQIPDEVGEHLVAQRRALERLEVLLEAGLATEDRHTELLFTLLAVGADDGDQRVELVDGLVLVVRGADDEDHVLVRVEDELLAFRRGVDNTLVLADLPEFLQGRHELKVILVLLDLLEEVLHDEDLLVGGEDDVVGGVLLGASHKQSLA